MTHTQVDLKKPYDYAAHSYHWQRGAGNTPQQQQAIDDWKVNWVLFNQALDKGEDVFVQITEARHKHFGSIAKITEREIYRGSWEEVDSVWLTLGWDKRKNAIREYSYGSMVWLKDYQGPTVYDYDRSRGMEPVRTDALKDRTGREIKVGDFCCYILHHFQTGGAGIYFGTVTKFSKNGNTAYLKNIKIEADDIVDEKRVTYSENIVVLTKDLMDRMMMARLSLL
jgi:hypothetical protein